MPNPISESHSVSTPWTYSNGHDVLADSQAFKDLFASWKQEDVHQAKKIESAKLAAEYDRAQEEERTAFMARSVELAKTGTNRTELESILVQIQKELRTLEIGNDNNEQNLQYTQELGLLREALNERLTELSRQTEKSETSSLVVFHDALEKYLNKNRMVRVLNTEGRVERKSQPTVKTEIAESDSLEEWRTDAEFEVHFNRLAISQAQEQETQRQELLRAVVNEAVQSAIEKGLLPASAATSIALDAWQPGKDFEDWFADNNSNRTDRHTIQENFLLLSLEKMAESLLYRSKYYPDNSGHISQETATALARAERNVVKLRQLKISTEVVDHVLFSTESFSAFVWKFLTRPDIQASLLETFDKNSAQYWKMIPQSTREKYGNSQGRYVNEKNLELQSMLKSKNNEEYAAFLLTLVGVDVDLLTQALDARLKNDSQPFTTNEQAAQALLGEEGPEWWQDIQTLEDNEPFLTPLTKRKTLIDEDFVILGGDAPSQQEHRMNFSNALHLKIGLDTPSKFVDYSKAHEVIETKALNGCMEVMNQLLLLRGNLPQENGQPQIDSLRNEQRFLKWNMRKFAESYVRLNQELGEMNGRNLEPSAPAREHLMNTFVVGQDPDTQAQRLSTFTTLMETELRNWFETHTLPQEKIFTKEQNEQERMS